jgi:NAD-dependent deacetylase
MIGSDKLLSAARLLQEARHITCLTGAGFSTASGIPDFRSSRSGLWEKDDPMEVASLIAFRQRPEKFFAWFRPLAACIYQARPNPAHLALARLEATGRFECVLTQNIDGLHQRAGSKYVYELHGNASRFTCPQCYRPHDAGPFFPAYLEKGIPPRCKYCHSILKPDAILFGEQLPLGIWDKAVAATGRSDLMIVAGTSLQVTPAANLPLYVRESRGKILIINQEPTYLDEIADVFIKGDVAELLPEIIQLAFPSHESKPFPKSRTTPNSLTG